ncbi:MAG: NrdH-redoxin [Candidatus Pacebacteria bacterium]|nr:NrdH-redoxin [Candidatus Paceibacterota bacterium]
MDVKIYTTPTCPYCHATIDFLKKNSIVFEEIDISKNEEIAADLIKRSDHIGVPIIEVNNKFVAGFDEEEIEKLLSSEKSED